MIPSESKPRLALIVFYKSCGRIECFDLTCASIGDNMENRKFIACFSFVSSLVLGSSLASAQQLGGAIAQKWWELGSENSVVGRPVSNEISIFDGGRVSCFERGAITWHPQVGAWAMYGDIYGASVFAEICRRGTADFIEEYTFGIGPSYPYGDETTSAGFPHDYDCPRGYRIQYVRAIPLGGGAGACWNPATRQITYVGPPPFGTVSGGI